MTVDRETWYRVPRSAEECAVHLEAGGVVEERVKGTTDHWHPTPLTPAIFRQRSKRTLNARHEYRLVYSTPVGMSPVIGAPGHAYGLARQAPERWDVAMYAEGWVVGEGCQPNAIIEARPPAPAPEPRTEKVPLTKLVGRTLVGETSPVRSVEAVLGNGDLAVIAVTDSPCGPLVEVLAEEEA